MHFMLGPENVLSTAGSVEVLHHQHFLQNTLYHTNSLASNVFPFCIQYFTFLCGLLVLRVLCSSLVGLLLLITHVGSTASQICLFNDL